MLLDGRPLPGQKVLVRRADEDLEGARPLELVTDSAGRLAVKVDRPGVLLALTRYRIGPRDGQPVKSLTYALTFDVGQ